MALAAYVGLHERLKYAPHSVAERIGPRTGVVEGASVKSRVFDVENRSGFPSTIASIA